MNNKHKHQYCQRSWFTSYSTTTEYMTFIRKRWLSTDVIFHGRLYWFQLDLIGKANWTKAQSNGRLCYTMIGLCMRYWFVDFFFFLFSWWWQKPEICQEKTQEIHPWLRMVAGALISFNCRTQLNQPTPQAMLVSFSTKQSLAIFPRPLGVACNNGEAGEELFGWLFAAHFEWMDGKCQLWTTALLTLTGHTYLNPSYTTDIKKGGFPYVKYGNNWHVKG